jgi:hypothetical protein
MQINSDNLWHGSAISGLGSLWVLLILLSQVHSIPDSVNIIKPFYHVQNDPSRFHMMLTLLFASLALSFFSVTSYAIFSINSVKQKSVIPLEKLVIPLLLLLPAPVFMLLAFWGIV